MNKIISPSKSFVYNKDDWYLYFDPTNITWIKVNEDGKKILTEFEIDSNYRSVVTKLKKKYEVEETVVKKFVEFLTGDSGYLHKDVYRKRTLSFPKKCQVPRSLYLHPTYRCNLKCTYCYNGSERNKYLMQASNNEELSLENYKGIFKQAKNLGITSLVYSGGEPLLRQDIFEIAQKSKELGFYNSLITNGTLITKKKAKEILRYFDRISVSIDSYLESENDLFRGTGAYRKTINGIQHLRELDGKITCLGVVHNKNIDSVYKSWDYFVKKLGCVTFMPQAYISYNDAVKGLGELEDFTRKYGRMRCKINYWNEINSLLKLCKNCGMCSSELAIGADGTVFPCQGLLTNEFACGNLKKDPLAKILEYSPVLNKLREFTVDEIEECSNCELKYVCGGGCRATNLKLTGNFLKNNRFYCAINREIIINSMFEMSTLCNQEDMNLKNSQGKELQNTCL